MPGKRQNKLKLNNVNATGLICQLTNKLQNSKIPKDATFVMHSYTAVQIIFKAEYLFALKLNAKHGKSVFDRRTRGYKYINPYLMKIHLKFKAVKI